MLRVNLDESSLKLHVPRRPGLVFEPHAKRRRALLRQGDGADLQTRRSAVTLVSFVCDDELVQHKLPQVLITNEHVVTKSDVEAAASKCSGNVLIIRRKSSWVNASVAVELINALAKSLREELRSRHVILHLDTVGSHTHASVLEACGRAGIHVHFVPAKTTALLQPLDVAVFSVFKGWVVREVERQRLASASGVLTKQQVLDIYRRGVDEVIRCRSWTHAFEHTGLRGQQNLSRSLMERLHIASPPTISSDLPKNEDFEIIFPRGKDIPLQQLFATALANEEQKRKSALPPPRLARLPRGPRRLP